MLLNTELNAAGWIFMLGSITAVGALVIYCYKRILTNPENDEPDLPGGLGP
ncbi:MAG: hypothetical protein KAI24_25325 [Planctomycetes bacterium]|nr:hypothetical protein [Planctomycetota bacterium]